MKTIKLIDKKENVYISEISYFIKSENCNHSNKEVCSKCILFGSYIPLQVLKALKDGSGDLK